MADITLEVPQQVEIGQEFDVVVHVTGVTNFDAGQFDISIPRDKANYIDTFAGEIGGHTIPIAIVNPNYGEDIRVVVNVEGIQEGITGDGTLATLRFKALDDGNITIDIDNGFINDCYAIEISAGWSGADTVFFRRYDVDGNGVIDQSDIDMLVLIIAGIVEPTIGAESIAEGEITTRHLTLLERIIAGL